MGCRWHENEHLITTQQTSKLTGKMAGSLAIHSSQYTHTPVQWPFFWDYPGESEPER